MGLISENAKYFKILRGFVLVNFGSIRHFIHAKFCPSKELSTFVWINGK